MAADGGRSVTPTDFIRPSSLEALALCPARAQMEARACALVPALADYASEPARQGSMAHAVIAAVLADCAAGDWRTAPAILAGLGPRMAGLARWAADATQACLRYALDLVRSLLERFAAVDVLVEQHLDGAGIGVPRGGSADLVLLCRAVHGGAVIRVVIADWKTGFLSQGDAADHLQLAAYSVMAWDRYRPQSIEAHLAMGRRREFTAALYREPEIEFARLACRAAANAARDPAAEIRPSLKACRYCRALPLCRPATETIMTAADSLALFGASPHERLALQDRIAVAQRFAETGRALLKEWAEEERRKGVAP